MKKILFILGTIMFLIPFSVYADNATIDISSSNDIAKTGDYITVNIDITSDKAIGYYEYTIDYDSSMLKLTSGNEYIVNRTNDSVTKDITKTFKFKVLDSGDTKITVKSYAVLDTKENNLSVKVNPLSIKASKSLNTDSTNNYLKSLEVEGYNLKPKFSKNTLKYTLDLSNDVKKVKINAIAEDENATIKGTGEVKLTTGENIIKIKVISQSGDEKIYTLMITKADKNPIKVTINNEEYTVVKDSSTLDKPNNFKAKEITIDGQKVIALYNKDTNYYLVGLKDKYNNIELYIYNKTDNSYILYKELVFDEISFISMEAKEIPDNYSKYTITINEYDITCYKLDQDSNFSLIYGMNAKTGEEGWYSYDESNNTIQKYNSNIDDYYKKEIQDTQILIYILGGTSLLFGITIIVMASKFSNKKRKY